MKRLDEIFPIERPEPHWDNESKTKEERALTRATTAPLGPTERARWVPAARCRECGVVTWKISLSGGRRQTHAPHAEGCSQPPGKFDRDERGDR